MWNCFLDRIHAQKMFSFPLPTTRLDERMFNTGVETQITKERAPNSGFVHFGQGYLALMKNQNLFFWGGSLLKKFTQVSCC